MRWLSPPDSVPDARDEGEIIEPDVAQEGEPVDDLLQDAMRDFVALGVELRRQALGPFDRGADRELAHLADVLAVDLDRQRLGLEAKTVAGLAWGRGHVALDLLARPLAFRLFVPALEIGDHALERLVDFISAKAVVIGEADLVRARTVQDHAPRFLRQFAPRLVEPEFVSTPERLERLQVIGRTRFRPGRDRALAQAELCIGDDQRVVDPQFRTQASADRTGAERIVEREQPGLDLGDGEARDRTGELGREENPPRLALALDLVGEFGHRQAIGKFERSLEALGEARAHVRPHDNAVDDHLDVVLEFFVERRRIRDLVEFAVDLQPLEAALHIVGDFLTVFALPAAHDRGQQIEARALR